jgi:hypothetical protein
MQKNNPFRAFSLLDGTGLYKNIVTCGNGYFHGVIEEVARDAKTPHQLAKILAPICADGRIRTKGNCYHGVGHAAMIQTEYKTSEALSVCEQVASSVRDKFICNAGAFMEYAQLYPVLAMNNGELQFTVCDALPSSYQPACYLEHSAALEKISSKEPFSYLNVIGNCRAIKNPTNRMACIKLFAIRSVRIARTVDIQSMCKNTSTRAEQVMCTAVVADRIGGSLDAARTTIRYRHAVKAVCATVGVLYAPQCEYLVLMRSSKLFYTEDSDTELPSFCEVSRAGYSSWLTSLSCLR